MQPSRELLWLEKCLTNPKFLHSQTGSKTKRLFQNPSSQPITASESRVDLVMKCIVGMLGKLVIDSL